MDFSGVKETLAGIGVSPDKRLGQSFLVDEAVADREIGVADIRDSETVLEIGPGLGILTSRLCARAGLVIAVEKDRRLARHLSSSIKEKNLRIVEGDALAVELPEFDLAMGNLPYSVSSPIIFRLVDAGMARAVFMIQKEVAERVVAGPHTAEYSRMSATLQRQYEVAYHFDVGHSHFYPQPEVDSAVIELRRKRGVGAWKVFDEWITLLFSQRRKTINSILRKSVAAYSSVGQRAPYGDRRIEELEISEMEGLVTWIEDNGLKPPGRR